MNKGIFWVVNDELLCVKVECDMNGTPQEFVKFSAKSGDNFNHKAEWLKLDRKVTNGKPYNYYYRGRVEVKNNKATIYINPDVNTEEIQKKIIEAFNLENIKLIFKSDGSSHYQALVDGDK